MGERGRAPCLLKSCSGTGRKESFTFVLFLSLLFVFESPSYYLFFHSLTVLATGLPFGV